MGKNIYNINGVLNRLHNVADGVLSITPPHQFIDNQLITLYLFKNNMKKLSRLKALLLSLMMVVCFVLPSSAQKSDGFFKANDDIYNDRSSVTISSGSSGGLQTDDLSEVPVGCGLLILTAAGAGYALTKRRKGNK